MVYSNKYKSRYDTYLEGIKSDILETLRKEEHTIESLRIELGINWKTARDRLRVLENSGIVCKKRVGRLNLYYLNHKSEKEARGEERI